MIAGSLASSAHGIPRSTHDIDIVIDPTFASLEHLLKLLATKDRYVDPDKARAEFLRRGQFNVIDMTTGWKADLIFRKARPFSRSEIDRSSEQEILGVHVLAASAEDTILSKLEWAAKSGESERQLRDVRGILDTQGDALDFAYIEQWLDELGVRELWDRVRS
ncbi:hypothetical protein LZC95_39000 [Pendulispora brunnea]|uniref:Uncharacterized protein n=1 Tax=Pendulispora brunnea TaxID=2905690 RepID=A0ABZ2K1D9_9BACT